MHSKAKAYDEERGYNTEFGPKEAHKAYPKDFIPTNRPCDWCGEIVASGFIHEECSKLEQEWWLDILC